VTRAESDGTGGDGFKLKEGRIIRDIRKKFFLVRVVKPWHRLPREVVEVPSLEPFQARLDGAGSTLIRSCRCPCSLQGDWTRWPLKVPSHPNHLVIL